MASLADLFQSTYPAWWGKPYLSSNFVEMASAQERENESYSVHRERPYLVGVGSAHKELLRQQEALARCYETNGTYKFQPTLRARVYAHDRIVLTSYEKPPVRLLGPKKSNKRNGCTNSRAALVKRRETRRGFKIGGRLRFQPQPTKFTVSGRNWVRDAGHIVEHYSKGIGIFLTPTVAGGTDEVYECLSAASGYIADRINRWLRDRVVDGHFVYVWELQRRGAPHMHYLFRLPADCDVDDFRRAVSVEWRKILLDCSSESGVDLFARVDGGTWRGVEGYPRVDVRRINGRYGSYLAKYTSKNASKDGQRHIFRPGRWWAVSYSLRAAVLQRRLDIKLPLRSIEQGVHIAETLISQGEGFIQGSRWANLPEWMSARSCSVQCEAKEARAVALALFFFVESGEVDVFAARLSVIRANNLQVKNNGPGLKTAV